MKKMILILAMVGVTRPTCPKQGRATYGLGFALLLNKSDRSLPYKGHFEYGSSLLCGYPTRKLGPIEKQYFSMVTDSGVDTSKFTEKEVEYYATGYQRDGTVLYYETPSKEIAMKLAKTNMQGVQMQFQIKEKISQEQTKTALEEALKDAKANAEQLCKTIGTAVGEIISISSNHYDTSAWVSYYSDYEQSYSVSVSTD